MFFCFCHRREKNSIKMSGYFDSFDPTSYVRNLLQKNKVVIISSTTCPYCDLAQDQFQKIKQPTLKFEINQPEKYNLSRNQSMSIFKDVVSKTNMQGTVPKVFICGKFVGGGDDVAALQKRGVLSKMVEDCDLASLKEF